LLPQVALPQPADYFVNADMLQRRGSPRFSVARSVADEIAQMPTADEIANRLQS
jgi:hypothetical protein